MSNLIYLVQWQGKNCLCHLWLCHDDHQLFGIGYHFKIFRSQVATGKKKLILRPGKAPLSRRISVDNRPDRRKTAASQHLSAVVWTGPWDSTKKLYNDDVDVTIRVLPWLDATCARKFKTKDQPIRDTTLISMDPRHQHGIFLVDFLVSLLSTEIIC